MECIIANTSVIWQHAAHTTDQPASPTAKQEPYKKAHLLTKNTEEFSGKTSEERNSRQKKRYDRKSNRTRQKNKRGNRKVESNDSPEIPEGGGGRHQTSPTKTTDVSVTHACDKSVPDDRHSLRIQH